MKRRALWTWTLFLSVAACGSWTRQPPEECGDGEWTPLEVCEPSDPTFGAWCTDACTWNVCGDGLVGPDETCDPPGEGCSDACRAPTCGDGLVDPGEVCAAVTRVSVGAPGGAAVGDLDGDGDEDLAVVDTASDEVVLLINDGLDAEGSVVFTVERVGLDHPVRTLVVDDRDLVVLGSDAATLLLYNGLYHVRYPVRPDGLAGGSLDWVPLGPAPAGRWAFRTVEGARELRLRRDDEVPQVGFAAPVATALPEALGIVWPVGDDLALAGSQAGTAEVVLVDRGDVSTATGPAVPRAVRKSRIVSEDERAHIGWLGEDEVLYLLDEDPRRGLSPVASEAVPGASAAAFVLDDQDPAPVWVADDGVHTRLDDEDRTLLALSGLEQILVADLDGDDRLDVVTLAPAAGEVVVVRQAW